MKDQEFELTFHPKPTLRKLYVEITARCNLSCVMCFRRSMKSPQGDMSEEIFHSILEGTKDFPHLSEIVFGGIGENFVHPHFLSWVREAREKNLEVTIFTNGTLLDERKIEALLDLDVSRLMISLDSPDPLGYDQIRGHNLEKLLAHIAAFNEAKKRRRLDRPWLISEFVLMRNNYHSLPALVDLASRYDIREIHLTNLMPFTSAMVDQSLYHPALPDDLDDVLAKARLRSFSGQVALIEPEFSLKTERRCQFMEDYACAIGWQGQISPCFRHLHSYQEYVYGRKKDVLAYDFGNLQEKTLYEIWTSQKYMEFRYKIGHGIYPSCPDCNFVNGCDYVLDSDADCYYNSPGCADCLWSRRLALCP
ncbi:tungsten cofactor oxidoreductase radical SAM maturase [Heliorestis acidaminivorans]|uniref:Tungsten cofactor oxidoreductase radical SAM maturase n=1 Tax=Heliorestis acidaminivorans TaxID=553427 RepID=A0A6I0EPF4_9FIRM|nr:tungsten cofactor oxidoreductase radical SAM maturase [Heliorestis acidaminivorans]KAB2950986.1 tungsten cofactor oxidoreductase radical SAM maturase [Heliorestis acidaminivorans]